MTEQIDLVFSGSGTLVPCHVGAWAKLVEFGLVPKRAAGTSGGSLAAAAIAHRWKPAQAMILGEKFLRGGLLDHSWWFFDRWGAHHGDRIHALVRQHFPGDMGDAPLEWGCFVVDLETRAPLYLSSKTHPKVPTADALMASCSIPAFFKARCIEGLPGLFVDGGVSANFALGVFDDEPTRRTIGVRFSGRPRRRPVRNVGEWAMAVASSMHEASNRTYVSSKRYADVIEVRSDGDGLDFTLSAEQVRERYAEGERAVLAWMDR